LLYYARGLKPTRKIVWGKLNLTTAPEWDGSLSGARTREAVSWGKVKETASHVTVEGDATVLLPLMVGALMERL
jgi:deoxyhypusine synthase